MLDLNTIRAEFARFLAEDPTELRPAGILTAMALHPRLVALYRKPNAGRDVAGTTTRS